MEKPTIEEIEKAMDEGIDIVIMPNGEIKEACKNCLKLRKRIDELEEEDNKLRAEWFKKGQMSVKRKNESGCCCIINDADEVVSVCGAHKTWMEEQLPDAEGKGE